MKKVLIIIITIFTLTSCNSSDNDLNLDPIIGTWQLTSILQNNQELYIANECDKKSYTTYFKDGTFFESSHFKKSTGDCSSREYTSNWINLENSNYKFDEVEIKLDFFNNNKNYKITINVLDSQGNNDIATIIFLKI